MMIIRFFMVAFCFSILFFSVSDKQSRSLASAENITPVYDASYKL